MKIFGELFLVVVILVVQCLCKDMVMDHNAINQKQKNLVMDHVDMDYKPCSDFYQYACYKWSDLHEEHRDNYTSVAEMLNYEMNMEIMDYVEKTPMKDMPSFVQVLKAFYESCVESQELIPLKFMQWMKKEANMKWALFTPNDSKNVKEFSWPTTLAMFRKYGLNDIFLETSMQFQSLFSFVIDLDEPSSDRFSFMYSFHLEAYNDSIPLPEGTMDFMKLWEIIEKFEDKFNGINVEKQKKIFKFNELPYPWLKEYVTALMKPQKPDADMEIIIDNVAYLEAFNNIIKEYDGLFLCRYLEVRFLHYLEVANKRDSPNECMTNARSFLPMAIDWIYAQLHPELLNEIPKVQQMFENVVKNINKTLHMDKYGLIPKEFFTKLETMHLMVGSSLSEKDMKMMESYYGNLHLTTNDYYGNYLQLLELYNKMEYSYFVYSSYLRNSDDIVFKIPSYTYYSDIRPQYYPSMNLLIFPLGLLRPPVYHVAFADIFKQSSLATLMGLSIFESFDGKQYGFSEEEAQKITGIAAMHASFEIFFSSLTEQEISKYLTMFGFTSLQQLKQMYFLNAIYYNCDWYMTKSERVGAMVNSLLDFIETYDCKMNGFLRMF
ncbi:membrane metallo-endopeptidase-like 1 [Musca autumnalis]|uniref:membrane metallo-endopeptidase-like 1 n=1 Tax=Musca autumnalis TaxID=221902 RepID=UPI003CEAC23C